MNKKTLLLVIMVILLVSCNPQKINESTNDNLINKVNAVNDRWLNYEGISQHNNTMIQSQFIPYHANKTYKVNYPTYISYYNGEQFIKTELYQETPNEIDAVIEADGIIVSFNKKNKSGMKLVAIE